MWPSINLWLPRFVVIAEIQMKTYNIMEFSENKNNSYVKLSLKDAVFKKIPCIYIFLKTPK